MMSRSKSPSSTAFNQFKAIKFCHYKNAMYMGEMKCFEREGRGIVLLDSGEVAVAGYKKDKLQGETTLITATNQVYSLLYNHNVLLQLVGKDSEKMLYVKFKHEVQEGLSTLINFKSQEITYTIFKQGKITRRYKQLDTTFLTRVFQHQNLSMLIPINHLKALNLEFRAPYIEVIKKNTSITVGFHKQGFMNGLGFVLLKDPERERNSYSLLEKGYYKDSQLQGVGQKRFQNGNRYIGEFKGNLFQGRGLLFNSARQNWVKGIFRDGNMVDMVEYSNQGQSKDPKIADLLVALHKKKSSWMNSEIKFHRSIDFNSFLDTENAKINEHPGGDEMDFQQRKQMVLKKIQDNFLPQSQAFNISVLTRNCSSPSKTGRLLPLQNTKKSINSFKNQHDPKNKVRLSMSPMDMSNVALRDSRKRRISPSTPYLKAESKPQKPIQKGSSNSVSREQFNNIYTFEEEPVQFSPKRSRSIFSNQKRFNRSARFDEEQTPHKQNSLLSRVSGSRRNKIFDGSPSRNNSSRMVFPSPQRSPIRQTQRNIQDSGASSMMQQMGRTSNRSRKMVRSRIFQEEQSRERDQLPTFGYSRFKTEDEIMGLQTRKSRIF